MDATPNVPERPSNEGSNEISTRRFTRQCAKSGETDEAQKATVEKVAGPESQEKSQSNVCSRPHELLLSDIEALFAIDKKMSTKKDPKWREISKCLLDIKEHAYQVVAETNVVSKQLEEARSHRCSCRQKQLKAKAGKVPVVKATELKSATPEMDISQQVVEPSIDKTDDQWILVQKKRRIRKRRLNKTMTKRIIISQRDNESSLLTKSDIMDRVKSVIKPRESNIMIHSVVDIGPKGIAISVDSSTNLALFTDSAGLEGVGLKATEPEKRLPKVIIYNVSSDLDAVAVKQCLINQNCLKNEDVKVLFKIGERSKESVHWVVEVQPATRKSLLKSGKVHVDWMRCHVKEFLVPTRCFKCQRYGHVAKSCRAHKETCGHCAQNGHGNKLCPNKEKPICCVSCRAAKRPHDHKIGSVNCNAYKNAVVRLKMNTKYDG